MKTIYTPKVRVVTAGSGEEFETKLNAVLEELAEKGRKQELTFNLAAGGVKIDTPLISKIESGIVKPGVQIEKALRRHLQVPETGERDEAEELDGKELKIAKKGDYTEKLMVLIPEDEDNAVTRNYLSIKLGLSDRVVRRAIEEARADGLLICNAQDGRGYYQSKDIAALKRQYLQDTARAMAILKRRKPLRDYLKAQGEEV